MRNLPSMSWDKCTAITGVEPGGSQLPTDASGLSEAVKVALMAVVALMVRVQVPVPAAAHAPPHWSNVPTEAWAVTVTTVPLGIIGSHPVVAAVPKVIVHTKAGWGAGGCTATVPLPVPPPAISRA